jgi:1,4-alpha-glucan branching enzyme
MDWEVEVGSALYTREIFNSDAVKYGGSGTVYNPDIRTVPIDKEGKRHKIIVNLPALSGIVLK